MGAYLTFAPILHAFPRQLSELPYPSLASCLPYCSWLGRKMRLGRTRSPKVMSACMPGATATKTSFGVVEIA